MVRSSDWSTQWLYCFTYCLGVTDKRPQRSNVNMMNLLQNSQYFQNIFFFRKASEVLLELVRKRSRDFTIINQEKQDQTNLNLEPHDYRIYYVNIDLRHQYGISVAELQTFLLVKRPQQQGVRRNTYSQATYLDISLENPCMNFKTCCVTF